ncbi:sigma-70 family RNA polymerase sigma factor [Saccharibacillus deserti]|uniref:sigma-70 family RNA polymerase sigma factor n=1 Tax=Saccharibacillus deserti TaxID=1634444 RepID=UPI001FE4F936|nr:sigma-70 family RNA polymerase sigma factor [Saccharibacillus deserti]
MNTAKNGLQGQEAEWAGADLEELYVKYRKYAFAIAYRMLGSAESAEDAVQDCFAELHRRKPQEIVRMKAYIARMVTNTCLNMLNSARSRRETYVGEWLPEPVGDSVFGPEEMAEQRELLSYAYLVLLERLTPGERAVFVLREAFQYDYAAIAEMTGRSEAGCRQIYSRFKRSLQAEPAASGASPPGGGEANVRADGQAGGARAGLLRRFTAAFAAYDVGGMLELLAEQPVFTADGGGREVRTVVRPMVGRKGVLALLTSRKIYAQLREWEAAPERVNGELQLVFRSGGRVKAVLCLQLEPGEDDRPLIRNLYLILAEEKLGRIDRASS